MNKYQTLLMIPLSVVLLGFAGGLQAKKILLWNTLDSEEAVLNSEIGPNGTIIGTAFAFESGQFGNGYIRKAIGDNWVEFPQSIPEQLHSAGTVEMWIVPKVPHPVPYEYGAFGLLNGPYSPYVLGFGLTWGDGVTGLGLTGALYSTVPTPFTPQEPQQFVATPGVPFHVALTWDVAGIDGSADTMRVYRDGNVVGSTTTTWDPDSPGVDPDNPGLTPYPLQLGWSPDGGGFDKFITDQIIVRDYAKVSYADRFDAVPSIPEPETYVMLLAGLGLLGFMARRRRETTI
jgi:hypothetical protein